MPREEEKIVHLSRDPFARMDYVKKYYGIGKCDWCGRKGKVWRYGTWSDGLYSKPEYAKGNFCTKSCFESYHM